MQFPTSKCSIVNSKPKHSREFPFVFGHTSPHWGCVHHQSAKHSTNHSCTTSTIQKKGTCCALRWEVSRALISNFKAPTTLKLEKEGPEEQALPYTFQKSRINYIHEQTTTTGKDDKKVHDEHTWIGWGSWCSYKKLCNFREEDSSWWVYTYKYKLKLCRAARANLPWPSPSKGEANW